jgi:hypothetical protein
MKSIDNLIIAAALMAFAGCASTPTVHSKGDTAAQVNSSQSFALLPVAVDSSVSPAAAPTVAQAAQNGARDTLRALGYTETSRESADLVFYLHGKCLAPVEVAKWNYVPETSKLGLKPNRMTAYANHMVVVEGYDNHSKQQVWMGWINCNCHVMEPEQIQHEIQRIVATFPPRNQSMNLSAR